MWSGVFLIAVLWSYFPSEPTSRFFLGVVLVLPSAVDGTTQLLGSRESNNPLRFVTGIMMGVGVYLAVSGVIRFGLSV